MRFGTMGMVTILAATTAGVAHGSDQSVPEYLARIFSTTCAGRAIGEAYQNPKAVAFVKAAVDGNADEVAALAAREPGLANTVEDGAVPPLLWTICADNLAGFEALLKAGADPNLAGNGHGRGDGRKQGIAEHGSIIYEGWSATLMAASLGRPEFLEAALRYGGNVNSAKGSEGGANRPLLIAASYGHLSNVKILIGAGADINAHSTKTTAPEYALGGTGHFDIAVWLLERGYTYELQRLASYAEVRHVPLEDEQQRWKEKLIGMLRERGAVFPASPGIKRAIEIERDIPPQDVEAIVLGRKSVFDYPRKAAR